MSKFFLTFEGLGAACQWLCLLLLTTMTGVHAQAPSWQSVIGASQSSGDYSLVNATATDASGNVYIAGYFSGTATFGNTSLSSSGGTDAFVAKWSPVNAAFVWARRAGGTGGESVMALAVAGTSVYLTGYFSGATASFGNATLAKTNPNSTLSDIFIAKLTDSGSTADFVWAQQAGGDSDDLACALVASGPNVYVAGRYNSSTASFGSTVLSNAGTAYPADGFVAKLVDAGLTSSFSWAQRVGGSGGDYVNALAVNGSNVYLAGSFFEGSISFGATTLTNNSRYNHDVFVAKLIDVGNASTYAWAQQAGSTGNDIAYALAANGSSVYVAGAFRSNTIGFGTTTLTNTNTYLSDDVFVAKLTDAGNTAGFVWAQQAGGTDDDEATALAVAGPSVYVTGRFASLTAAFGSTTLTSAGAQDVFLTKLTDAGPSSTIAWARPAGGGGYDSGNAVAVNGTRVYVGGTATRPAAFGNQSLSGPAGASGAFLALLNDAPAPVLLGFNPLIGTAGDLISLTGTNLTGATSISFTGTRNQVVTSGYTVSADGTQLTGLRVPDGAQTGPISVTTASGTATSAQAFVVVATWTGAVSVDWATPGNWKGGIVPTRNERVAIGAAPRMPVVSGQQEASILGLFADASLTLADNASLSLYGAVPENDGQAGLALAVTGATNAIRAQSTGLRNGTLRFVGASRQKIDARGGSQYHFDNVYVGPAGIQLYRISAHVHGLLTLDGDVTATNAYALNDEPLVLVSDESGTALVVNNGNSAVTGNVTVQRYLSPALNPGLGYHHYAAPVSTATVASLATAVYSPVVNPTYNVSASPARERPFPTVLGYDQSRLASTSNDLDLFTKGWYSPADLGDALTVGQGYAVNLSAGQALSVRGALNNGDLTLALARNSGPTAAESGLALVGNPYPAPLDWSSVTPTDRPGLDGALYVFQSTSQYGGQYRSYVNGVGDPVVAQGQGFFVRVTPGQTSGQLTFRNTHRLTTYQNPALYRTSIETRSLVQLTLQGAGTPYQDQTTVYFQNGATASLDAEFDAPKLANSTGLNLSARLPGGQQLSIDGRPALGVAQLVVPLAVGVPTPGSYSLTAAQLLNLRTTTTYLRDLLTGTMIDLAQQPSYPFTVVNASSLLTGRFELVFSPQQTLATTAATTLSQQVALYPNPASGTVSVELPSSLGHQTVAATLFDAVGRPVRALILPAQGTTPHVLTLSELPSGIYLLHLRTSVGTLVKKLTLK